MLIHSVFFWLRSDLGASERATFLAELQRLAAIGTVRQGHVGRPAATGKRTVIDDSYDIGLVAVFDDLAAHDAYQRHPVHLAFLERCRTWWAKLIVYDLQA